MNRLFYRKSEISAEELTAATKAGLTSTDSRIDIQPGDLVIPRYSALPCYQELENDIKKLGATLINSYRQHRFVANISAWYPELEDLTPKTWFALDELPDEGPFFLKGETNSKKFSWDLSAYAANKKAAIQVYLRLTEDSLIGSQSICCRKFVPLKTYMLAPRGLPITKEFRFFILDGETLTGAYYWSSHVEDLQEQGISIPSADEVPKEFMDEIIKRVQPSIRFWVVDVAQTEAGEWIVIELNDGQMSGLSENDPIKLYASMARVLG